MKKKIFFRFFAVTLIAVLLMFSFGIIAVKLNTKNVVKERLREETELAATLLTEKEDFSLFEKYEGNRDLRITVLDLEGNVLYESDTTAALENHADREEIRNALAGTPDTARRYSETFKCDMTYYAIRTALEDGGEVILRLAVKSSQISAYVTALLPLLILVLAISLVISFLFSGILSGSVSSKVTEIGESLKSLNHGEYVPIKTDMSEPELYTVLGQINELNANIHSHIRVADGERVKLNTVLDNVSQGIIAFDKDKRIVFANKSALTLFHGTDRAITRELAFLVEDLSLCENILSHLEEDYGFQANYDAKILSVVISKVKDPVISDEIPTIVILTDVTEVKLVEKQKSDFFANASHELKTPITVLQGFSEVLLNKEGIDDGSKKQIARIYKESQRLGTLISDMLTLSRIESGEVRESTPTLLSLDSVAVEIFGALSEEIKKKDLTAEVKGCASLTADYGLIYELMENLISNAVKYNREGGSVTVALLESEKGVCLQVTDTGIGIAKEHLPRLCERFYRVDKSHSKRIGGTGLGLAIVKHICAILSAELTIESELGVGTTVSIVWERDRSEAAKV